MDLQVAVCRETLTMRSIRQGARQFCSSLMNSSSAWNMFRTPGSLVLFNQLSHFCSEIDTLALENDSLHYLYARSFENTCWGLAGGLFGASGRPRGGLWVASGSHLHALGRRLKLCGSVLEGQVT